MYTITETVHLASIMNNSRRYLRKIKILFRRAQPSLFLLGIVPKLMRSLLCRDSLTPVITAVLANTQKGSKVHQQVERERMNCKFTVEYYSGFYKEPCAVTWLILEAIRLSEADQIWEGKCGTTLNKCVINIEGGREIYRDRE